MDGSRFLFCSLIFLSENPFLTFDHTNNTAYNFNIYNDNAWRSTFVDFTDKKQYKNGFQSKYNNGFDFFEYL